MQITQQSNSAYNFMEKTFSSFQKETNVAGDDYYWQHQLQLQKSALDFASSKKPTTTTQSLQSEYTNKKIILESTQAIEQSHFSKIPMTNSRPSEPNIQNNHFFLSKITNSMTKTANFSLVAATTEMQNNDNDLTLSRRQETRLHRSEVKPFKTYHCLIQDKTVAFAFSTPALSKIERSSLQKTIKKLFKQLGLQLRQLVINGVKQ